MIIKLNSTGGKVLLNSTAGKVFLGFADITATPEIGTLGCTTSGGIHSVVFDVTNEDADTATIEVSEASNFDAAQSLSVLSGESGEFSFSGYTNPPGSVTFYARATASGKLVSTTRSKTQSIAGCFGVG